MTSAATACLISCNPLLFHGRSVIFVGGLGDLTDLALLYYFLDITATPVQPICATPHAMRIWHDVLSRLNRVAARREQRASMLGFHPRRCLGRNLSVYIHSLPMFKGLDFYLNFSPPPALG